MTKPFSSWLFEEMTKASTSVTLPQARVLLNVLQDHPPPSPDHIQQSFREAACIYHPDSRHRPNARPCSATIRRCHEARDELLEHYHGTRSKSPIGGHSSSNRRSTARRTTSARPRGFPYRTLRVLTVKQNLALRGSVMLVLTLGTLYEELFATKSGIRV